MNIQDLQNELKSLEKRYQRYLKEKEKVRKRQQDVHFTPKDKEILIETFVIANIVENLISKAISKII
jgi:molecular chaperone GrpE (heat shock protein)